MNVPNETSVDLVKNIYKTAWESGCKGCTIYRDGSRSGVLVATDDKGKKQEDKQTASGAEKLGLYDNACSQAPQNFWKLPSSVSKTTTRSGWLFIGLLDGRPYEIFTGRVEDIFILPGYVDKGWVIKEKDAEGHNRYDFRFADKDGYKVTMEGLSRSFDKEFWNYAKLISGILRHGMPLPYVITLVAGLNVDQDHINTWKNGVVRALKKYIPDGTKAVKEACPECEDHRWPHL